MTRKDYVLIAGALRKQYDQEIRMPQCGEVSQASGIQLAAESIADALATDNPRFDRSRFMLAAVNGDGPVGLKSLLTFSAS